MSERLSLLAAGEQDWPALIAGSAAARDVVVLDRYHGPLGNSCSLPQIFGRGVERWVVKLQNNPCGDGSALITESVVAALGSLLGAPVADAAIAYIPADLDPEQIELAPGRYGSAGLHHATRWISGCVDAREFPSTDGPNRSRAAAIDVLYLWMGANDAQFIYELEPPNAIWSLDHGLFFARAKGREHEKEWTEEDLDDGRDRVERHPTLSALALAPDAYATVIPALLSVTVGDVVEAVAALPEEWGRTASWRVALAGYLAARYRATVQFLRHEGLAP